MTRSDPFLPPYGVKGWNSNVADQSWYRGTRIAGGAVPMVMLPSSLFVQRVTPNPYFDNYFKKSVFNQLPGDDLEFMLYVNWDEDPSEQHLECRIGEVIGEPWDPGFFQISVLGRNGDVEAFPVAIPTIGRYTPNFQALTFGITNGKTGADLESETGAMHGSFPRVD